MVSGELYPKGGRPPCEIVITHSFQFSADLKRLLKELLKDQAVAEVLQMVLYDSKLLGGGIRPTILPSALTRKLVKHAIETHLRFLFRGSLLPRQAYATNEMLS